MFIGRFVLSAAMVLSGSAIASAQFEIPGSRQTPTDPTPTPTQPKQEPRAEPRPVSDFDLKPQHGNWLVVVRSFRAEREIVNRRGENVPDKHVRALADSFAEYIRKQYKINAFVYPNGWELRRERDVQSKAAKEKLRQHYINKYGVNPPDETLRVKTVSIPDEYTVFVAPARGTLNDRETAIDFANQVRKLKTPAEFNDSVVQGSDDEKLTGKGSSFNAFLACMPGMNPMVPKTAVNAPANKADDFVMKLNSGETYSLLHKTRKEWTLLVQTFGQGATIVQAGATGAGSGEASDRLERAALQAQKCCELLRAKKIDAYVMHTRYHSMVFVGDYDRADDPQLLANKRIFANKEFKDEKTGKVALSFMEKPAAVMIPRP